MREIKFRAWDGKRMFHTDHGDIMRVGQDEFEWSPYCFVIDNQPNPPDVQRWVVMQYTGLKDRAGKEIYEGDIVQWQGYEVQSGKQVRPTRKRAIGVGVDPFRNTFIDDCFHLQNIIEHGGNNVEVIGNIYENPDLLKETP